VKTRWTKAEIRGQRLYWLLSITYAGKVIRLSSEDLDVDTDGGQIRYHAGIVGLTFSEAISLWEIGLQPTQADATVIMPPGIDVAALTAQGHRFGAATVELAQWYGGLAWEDRRVVLLGRVTDPTYGAAEDPVEFGMAQDVSTDKGQIPDKNAEVNADTWNDAYFSDADDGIAYPRVYGYPGKTQRALAGWITGSQAAWVSKQRSNHKLLIADGEVDATQVYINIDSDPAGELVNITTTTDRRGRTVTIVDYDAEGYDYVAPYPTAGANQLPDDYVPFPASEDVAVFVGWHDGGGLLGPDGTVLRDAGDVIEDVLSFSSLSVDHSAFSSVKPRLAWFKVDGAIDAPVTPWEWLSSELLPLLPVSLVTGPQGVYPVVWDHAATAADALDVIDADLDESIEVGRIESSTDRIVNDLRLSYGYSARTEEYLYEARVGPAFIAAAGQALARLSNVDREITVYALAEGVAGQGIVVTMTHTGAAAALTENTTTKVVEIEYDNASTTVAELVTQIQTSALITCEDSESTSLWASGDQTVRTYLKDTGTRGSPACVYSRDQLLTPDDDGVRTWTGESAFIYDDATADGVLGWMVAAFALEVRTIQTLLPEDRWGWLALGDVVGFTFADYSMDRQVCIVTAIEWQDDGLIGVGLTLIENPARDMVAA